MREIRLPVIRATATYVRPAISRALGRACSSNWSSPKLRLRAVLSLSPTLAGAQRAIVFGEETVLAAHPAADDAPAVRRLFERARRGVEDEQITPELHVARIAPNRPEPRSGKGADVAAVDAARAVAASCA